MRAVLVARTRMGQNVCVGVARESDGAAFRLVPVRSPNHHGWRAFDAPIGSRLKIHGFPASDISPPHVEDYRVSHWRAIGNRVADLAGWIRSTAPIRDGGPQKLFDGLLDIEPSGSRWLDPAGALPPGSVEFWELPFDIFRRSATDGKSGCAYAAAKRHSFRVKYVGLEPEIESVPAGTIVRVSLARAWRRAGDKSDRCWLQLSGWYPARGVELIWHAEPPKSPRNDDGSPF